MSRAPLDRLLDELSDRDLAVLGDVEKYRLLSSRQIQRLHFAHAHQTPTAGMRACVRVLGRLREHGLLRCLQRRIGGVRRGSAGYIWHLGPAGERLLRQRRAEPARRRYSEPSRHFVDHTVAVAELAVRLVEAARDGRFELMALDVEPASWRQHLTPAGARAWLKPDLHAITAAGQFEDHWFIEADLDTEHLPVILRQCAAYQAHLSSGRYQAEHEVFPVVLWVAPTAQRALGLRTAIARSTQLTDGLFRVCTASEFIDQFALPGR